MIEAAAGINDITVDSGSGIFLMRNTNETETQLESDPYTAQRCSLADPRSFVFGGSRDSVSLVREPVTGTVAGLGAEFN